MAAAVEEERRRKEKGLKHKERVRHRRGASRCAPVVCVPFRKLFHPPNA